MVKNSLIFYLIIDFNSLNYKKNNLIKLVTHNNTLSNTLYLNFNSATGSQLLPLTLLTFFYICYKEFLLSVLKHSKGRTTFSASGA